MNQNIDIENTEVFQYIYNKIKTYEQMTKEWDFLRQILITQHGRGQCPLQCEYCNFNRNDLPLVQITEEEQITVAQLIKQLVKRLNKKTQWVHFFGAEPLQTFDQMKLFRKLLPKEEYLMTFVSNCVLIDDQIQKWLDENDVYLTIQSIDGYKQLHDQRRKFQNGLGSFDKQIQGIFRLSPKVRKYMQWRQTWTQDNYDLVSLYKFFYNLGQEQGRISIIPDYLSNWDEEKVFMQIKNLQEQVKQNEIELIFAKQWQLMQNNIINQMEMYKDNPTDQTLREIQKEVVLPCQNISALQFYPQGQIKNCHLNYGNWWTIGNYITGKVNQNYEKHTKMFEDFNINYYKYFPKCRFCFQKQQCVSFQKCVCIIQPTRNEFETGMFNIPDSFCNFYRGYVRGLLYFKEILGDEYIKKQKFQLVRYNLIDDLKNNFVKLNS